MQAFYYHTTVFQSLGDSSHAPQTVPSQAVATIEAYVSLTYLILIFSGSLGAFSYIDKLLSPEVMRVELTKYFISRCSHINPVRSVGHGEEPLEKDTQ